MPAPPTRRRAGTAAAVARTAAGILFALAAAACTDDGLGDDPATTTTEAPTTTEAAAPYQPGELVWQPCNGIECSTLPVPLDYFDLGAGTTNLALVRVPANDPGRRIGTIVINPGGPGASALQYVGTGQVFDQDVHDVFDVVAFDPRGVGQSNALTCGADLVAAFRVLDPDPDSPAEQRALDDGAEAIAQECGAQHGSLLAHIGTADAVRDLEVVRKALGEEQISYVGLSYGTLIGQLYAEQHPEAVRAMVLDGVVDPADDLAAYLRAQAAAFDRAVDTMFEACEGDPSCPSIGAARAFDQLAEAVEDDPVPAGAAGDVGPAELANATIYATYLPTLWPALYAAYESALGGDGGGLAQLADSYRNFGLYPAYVGVTCIDGPRPTDAEGFQALAAELEEISPRFGASIVNELLPCAYWPVPPGPEPHGVQRPGTPPILVVGTTGDPATPFAEAERVTERLVDAVLVTFQSEGHLAFGRSACVDDYVVRYLEDLELPAIGTVCH